MSRMGINESEKNHSKGRIDHFPSFVEDNHSRHFRLSRYKHLGVFQKLLHLDPLSVDQFYVNLYSYGMDLPQKSTQLRLFEKAR